jgi:hypothetical protein
MGWNRLNVSSPSDPLSNNIWRGTQIIKLLNMQFSQFRVTSCILELNIFFNSPFSVRVHKNFPDIPHLERKTYTYKKLTEEFVKLKLNCATRKKKCSPYPVTSEVPRTGEAENGGLKIRRGKPNKVSVRLHPPGAYGKPASNRTTDTET